MPQFTPGEGKTAIAPITVSPAGLSSEVEIFLGPDEMTKVATSGRLPFTSTGVSQNIRLPLAMPEAEGTYRVFIDVYAEGLLIAAYQAIEDVVIKPVPASISVASVSVHNFPFMWYGEGPTAFAKFIKIQLAIESPEAFNGRIELAHPNSISKVPLMTEAEYQTLVAEMEYNIANNIPPGSSFWSRRVAGSLPYPSVAGFRIDFDWWDKSGWWWMFTQDWLTKYQPIIGFDVPIKQGSNIIPVGFFKSHYYYGPIAGLTVSLYRDEQVLDTVIVPDISA